MKKLFSFSVIIPALNEEYCLENCLKSLKNQDYRGKIEIIVADNGSSDKTLSIARSHKEVIAVEEQRKGVSFALRKGCETAHSEILVFTDADTKFPSHWLSQINEIFNSDSATVAVGGPYLFYDAGIVMTFLFNKITIPFIVFLYRLFIHRRSPSLACVNMAVKNEVYNKSGGFNPQINWGQEKDFIDRVVKFGQVMFDPRLIVFTSFRRYSGGHTNWLLIFFRAYKELIVSLARYFYVLLFHKILPAQKPIRIIPTNTRKKYITNGITFGVLLLAIIIYGSIMPSTQIFGSIVYRGQETANEKLVALTFDDGPYGEPTNQILNILREKNVQATFFVTGQNAQKYPKILQKEIADGHVIGNHSLNHSPTLFLQSSQSFFDNITQTDSIISNIANIHPRLFRPPYGLKSPIMLKALKKHNYEAILWNDMTDDYNAKELPEEITKKILKKLQSGSIITIHDGRDHHTDYPRDNIIQALPKIIDGIREAGYTPVTLDVLLHTNPYFSS